MSRWIQDGGTEVPGFDIEIDPVRHWAPALWTSENDGLDVYIATGRRGSCYRHRECFQVREYVSPTGKTVWADRAGKVCEPDKTRISESE